MLGKFIEDFLETEAAEKGAAQTTLSAYEHDLRQFLDFCNISRPQELSEDLVEKFIQQLQTESYAPKSLTRKLSAIKDFCKFLYSEKIIPTNPAAYILTPKQEKPLPKFLSVQEIRLLTDTAFAKPDYRYWRIGVMIELMYATGLRVSELVGLPQNAVNFKKGLITVFGKGSKERVVPVAGKALNILQEYLELRNEFIKKNSTSVWLFPSLSAVSGHLTRDAFYKDLKKLAVDCGIYPSRVSPHVLRHSFATHLLNNNADLRSVQKMLGHESIATTEVYTHIIPQKLGDVVRSKHPLSHFTEEKKKADV